jgi:hypothetical protein
MSIFLNVNTSEYPRFVGDLELLGWQNGEPLPEGWVEVIQDPIPEIENTQTYIENLPQLIDGVWKITWTVRDLTEEEVNYIPPLNPLFYPNNIVDE